MEIMGMVRMVFRVVDLAWDSPYTWLLTAVLVDLGYYWWVPSCAVLQCYCSVGTFRAEKSYEPGEPGSGTLWESGEHFN